MVPRKKQQATPYPTQINLRAGTAGLRFGRPHEARWTSLSTTTLHTLPTQVLVDECRRWAQPATGDDTARARTLISAYRLQEVEDTLRYECYRLGLDTRGRGPTLRFRLNRHHHTGFGRTSDIRALLVKRGFDIPTNVNRCDALYQLLKHEWNANREDCHWALADLEKDDAAPRGGDLIRDYEASAQRQATVTGLMFHPNLVFTQTNAQGDGNCLWRAFGIAFHGNENDTTWQNVLLEARVIYHLAANQVLPNNHVRRHRAALYQGLEHASAPANHALNQYLLSEQVARQNRWATAEALQLLADAYNVEIFAHYRTFPNGQPAWNARVFGHHQTAVRQIHLVNYVNTVHWTALTPPAGSPPFTAHLAAQYDLARQPLTGMHAAYGIGPYPAPLRRRPGTQNYARDLSAPPTAAGGGTAAGGTNAGGAGAGAGGAAGAGDGGGS